ncbi:inorganic phosphate transporter [Jatrophihabitans sp.]|uniref:inorganic phosphate transporter n=1 Tax=Jatrophihabitans sp. TaxID=1932789 RepID=UPI0030C76C13|nr:inorganic phosphate transporter [Jatrophihabitans sp.]
MAGGTREHGFRVGQIGTATLVSLAHGTNDAQKTMGIITLALVANGTIAPGADTPFWVIFCCASAIALGTYLGGWRVIRTLGKGLVEIEAPQGFAAEATSASIILASSDFGYPLSTTHVATGSILGSGLGRRLAEVRWKVAGRMAMAWLVTLPVAALVGGLAFRLADLIGGGTGVVVVFVLGAAFAGGIFAASRKIPVHADNVNQEWDGAATAAPAPVPV